MDAIHILWTKPFYAGGGSAFFIEDFDILTAALSALKWRQHNGSIAMITDTYGSEYIKKTGLACLWDEVRVTLDGINGDLACIAGNGVEVYDKATGLSGVFWIDSDTHTWENGTHIMNLELNFKNIMDSKEYTDEE